MKANKAYTEAPAPQNENKNTGKKEGGAFTGATRAFMPSCQLLEDFSKTDATTNKPLKHKTYFFNGNDHCENCNMSGDKFYMQETNCKGSKK